jgi:hypothetical protein
MPTSHSVLSESNHPDAIEQELMWLLKGDPLWRSDTSIDCVPLKKICNGSITEIANNLSNEWAWHGAPKRLGRRFESLLTALFEHTEQCKLLKHGLVVRDQKQTLGELDYLIQLRSKVLHLEVAVKFYAGIGSPSDRSRQQAWIGPSCQDRLDIKINHLLDHQLQLSQTELGRQALCQNDLPTPDQTLGLIYGYLIQPWNDVNQLPEHTLDSHPAFWAPHKQALAAMRQLSRPYSTDYGWTRLKRDQWIAPYIGQAALPQVIRSIEPPTQADCYALNHKQHAGFEKLRLFVMRNEFEQEAHQMLDRPHPI